MIKQDWRISEDRRDLRILPKPLTKESASGTPSEIRNQFAVALESGVSKAYAPEEITTQHQDDTYDSSSDDDNDDDYEDDDKTLIEDNFDNNSFVDYDSDSSSTDSEEGRKENDGLNLSSDQQNIYVGDEAGKRKENDCN